jgi:2-polyprenyl-3-methyl-5-hydroxy-6-metoxy-1,4-benzoquinol methylase
MSFEVEQHASIPVEISKCEHYFVNFCVTYGIILVDGLLIHVPSLTTSGKEIHNYGKKSYWNGRYDCNFIEEQSTYEWYMDWKKLKTYMIPFMQSIIIESDDSTIPIRKSVQHGKILDIGCGDSNMSADMHLIDEFNDIISIDFSEVAIKKMKSMYPHFNNQMYQIMDVTAMSFESNSFHIIIDKGTFDAVLCSDERHWISMLNECSRVLKRHGKMFVITYDHPKNR